MQNNNFNQLIRKRIGQMPPRLKYWAGGIIGAVVIGLIYLLFFFTITDQQGETTLIEKVFKKENTNH
ncbi:MAG: hypothetical protein ACTHMC_02665 [Pseudobacter sp.]|uniref:hypothetical protein n=1 Tax=Pseudobacter sp. TaxID=2045420 RepID=UPI003F7DCB73